MMTERQLEPSESGYKRLTLVAQMMTRLSAKGIQYCVGNTYLDYGQNWMWTTILAYGSDGSWQAINPREWQNIMEATTFAELAQIVEDHFKERFALDMMKEI